jgi:ABC-type multidrug transport system permease subunit
MNTFVPLVRHETRRARRGLRARLVFIALALVLAWLVRQAFEFALLATGRPSDAGSWQALAGQVVMFCTVSLIFLGDSVFADRDTGSDRRLRTAGVAIGPFLTSKLTVMMGNELVAALGVLALGSFVLEAGDPGSIPALVALTVAWCVFSVCYGILMVGLATSAEGFTMLCFASSMVFIAASGGLAPYALLADWAKQIGWAFPASPYLRGVDRVLLDDAGLLDVAPYLGGLLAWSAVVGAVGWVLATRRLTD